MGFLVGPFRFVGRVGGLVFTETPEGIKVAEPGGASKKRILNDPEFERTRENFAEFSGASTLAKIMYTPLKKYKDLFKPRAWNDILSEFVKVIQEDVDHNRGLREADTLKNGDIINNFDFGWQPLGGLLRFRENIVISEDRTQISWIIPEYPSYRINIPEKRATSCKFIMTVSIVPKLVQNSDKKYAETTPIELPDFYFTESFIMPVSPSIPSMELVIELNKAPYESEALVICIGMAFFEPCLGMHSFVKKSGGLKLVKIG